MAAGELFTLVSMAAGELFMLVSLALVVTGVVLVTYIVYRYYTRKLEYSYKEARLAHDELLVPDGGDETESQEGGD